jgi:GrpB-like predicted nucleotidyltransferase (UPF0157 family)
MPRGPVEIVEPQGSWSDRFRLAAAALREHLGALALRIDHIGSTSVPGLAAKDVIDLRDGEARAGSPPPERQRRVR